VTPVPQIPLFFLAHGRTGDKGDTSNISLVPYDAADYDLLARQVTAEAVKRHFGRLAKGEVRRYDLPKLPAFNFVLESALEGGVNDSLALDTHGKSRSSALMSLLVEVPDGHPALEKARRLPVAG